MNKFKVLCFSLGICIVLYPCLVFSDTRKSQSVDTATWWECDSVEIQISGITILIDPFFPFYRKANVILITHHHGDHCDVSSITRSSEVSGDTLDLIVGSKSCKDCFASLAIKEKRLADRGEVIAYGRLTIETVPSYEDVDDIGFIIRDRKTGLSILHMGDNSRYTDDFSKIQAIDYLYLAMGKMSLEDTILFLKAVKPNYLVPIHYKPTRGAFLPESYSYPSPDEPGQYLAGLKKMMEEAGINTEMLVLYPGQAQALVHKK